MSETSPQLENGYIRIANELFDVILAFPFTARQLKVVMAIMRKTYGYAKKTDDVSASQLAAMCSLQRTHVAATLSALTALNVITKKPGLYGSIVGINKKYSTWVDPENGVETMVSTSTETVQGCTETVHVPKQYARCTETVQVASTESVHTKDNFPKDNKQKTCATAEAFTRFWSAYPKKKSKGTAEKAFAKLNPDEQLLAKLLLSIGRAKMTDDWKKSKGQFIPYPASWLNARGWEDEIPADGSPDDDLFEAAI